MDTDQTNIESPDKLPMEWYIIKVQSNREDTIKERLLKQAAIAGLGEYFGQIVIPYERVSEIRKGKKYVVKRKLYPGYIIVQMVITEDTWFLVREIPGIGDFAGAEGKAIPLSEAEVQRILDLDKVKDVSEPMLNIKFKVGDRVKINDGNFVNQEGDVDRIDMKKGLVSVLINTLGQTIPLEMEYSLLELVCSSDDIKSSK